MSREPAHGGARAAAAVSDEQRWAQAQSILDGVPSEPAARRLRRAQRMRWLLVAGITVAGIAVGVAVAFLFRDGIRSGTDTDVSTARVVAGFSLSGVGLLVMVVGIVWQIRALRRARGYGSPMHVLTRRQRKELLAQIRGWSPVQPERLGLARHLAELLRAQELGLLSPAGLLVNFIGLWVATPSTWRLVTLGLFAPLVLVGAVLLRRQSRHVRRFVAAYPDSSAGYGA